MWALRRQPRGRDLTPWGAPLATSLGLLLLPRAADAQRAPDDPYLWPTAPAQAQPTGPPAASTGGGTDITPVQSQSAQPLPVPLPHAVLDPGEIRRIPSPNAMEVRRIDDDVSARAWREHTYLHHPRAFVEVGVNWLPGSASITNGQGIVLGRLSDIDSQESSFWGLVAAGVRWSPVAWIDLVARGILRWGGVAAAAPVSSVVNVNCPVGTSASTGDFFDSGLTSTSLAWMPGLELGARFRAVPYGGFYLGAAARVEALITAFDWPQFQAVCQAPDGRAISMTAPNITAPTSHTVTPMLGWTIEMGFLVDSRDMVDLGFRLMTSYSVGQATNDAITTLVLVAGVAFP